MLNVSPSGTFKRADWASVADASSTGTVWRWVDTGRSVRRGLRMALWDIERREYQRVGVESRGMHTTGCETKCQTTLCACETMARVQTGQPCLSFLAVLPQPYATFVPFVQHRPKQLPSACHLVFISFPEPTPWQPSRPSSVYNCAPLSSSFSININKVDSKRKQRVCDKILMSYVPVAAEEI